MEQETPKKYNLRKRKKGKKKIILDSDSDEDDDSDYIPKESDEEEVDGEEEFALRDWQRFIEKIFPSKHSKNRNVMLDAMDKLKEGKENEEDIYMDEAEFEEGCGDDLFINNPNMKVNIIFTVSDNYDEYDEDMSELEDVAEDDNDNEDDNEEESEIEEFEKGDKVEIKLNKWKTWKEGFILKKTKENDKILYRIKVNDKKYNNITEKKIRFISASPEENEELLKDLKGVLEKKKIKGKSNMIKQFEDLVMKQEEKIAKTQKEEDKKNKLTNNRTFKKLLHSRNVMCDFKYFRNLSLEKQQIILEQMKEIYNHSQLTKPYRITLLETDIPSQYKATAFNKINTLSCMDPGAGEYYKIKQWVDTFMKIPFGKYNSLPVNLQKDKEDCQTFMEDARGQLDNAVFGLNDAKMQIMQMIGQWISNPHSVGTAIAIHGPMGTGKTTLVKEGVSKILNRPFAFIALGGATDSSFLEGHSYTYEGSIWGKIVDILIQSKCMNPVIYFDELDKVSETPKGEEIIGILTHLTDTTQNRQFHDKYFSNIDFDLSKALFIFSYNDESKINPILRDRMYRIETKGYNKKEKTTIASKYLLPVIEKNIKFETGQVVISDEIIHYIIEQFTGNEKGVRNLKRCLEIIYSKLNLFRLMKPGSKLFDDKMTTLKVEFPYILKKESIDKLIKQNTANIPYGLYL